MVSVNNIQNYTIHPGQILRIKSASQLNPNDGIVLQPNNDIDPWILSSKDQVDLGRFKDKHGNTPLNKNSGTFKNGRHTIEKDNAGHGGRKWKLKKDGKRIASLDSEGNIISK